MRVLVLGAGGTVGTLLAEGLALQGLDVCRATRSSGDVAVDVLVDDPAAVLGATGATAVLYLAWATRDRRDAVQSAHADAAGAWATAAMRAGVPLVFASTTLAAPGVRSAYGRWKARAEVGVVGAGGSVARIGLVIDDALPGLLATTVRSATRRVPGIARGLDWPVFPVGSGDVVRAFAHALDNPTPRVWMAESAPVSLAEVACWPAPTPAGAGFRRLGRTLAATPALGGRRPALIDGWAGLVSGPHTRDPEFPPPAPGVGPPGSWRAFTRPA